MSMTPSTNEKETRAPKLEAQRKFDQAVYGGISYFAQAATGIVLAHWIRDGSGRKYFDAMSRWAGPRIITPITGKVGEEAVKAADNPIVVSTMIMCGNAFLIPVKWLESHKPEIVRKWQYALNAKREKKGEIITPEEHAEQETLLTQLDNKPKQTWGSLGTARAFSLAGVYAVLFGMDRVNGNKIGEAITGRAVQGSLNALGVNKAVSETAGSYARISFNDFFYSAVSAGGLYVWSHYLNPPKKKPSGEALLDAGEEIAEELTEYDAPTPAARTGEKPCPTGRCKNEPTSRLAALKSISTPPEAELTV